MIEIKRLDFPLSQQQIELYEKLTTKENYCYLHSKNPYEISKLNYIALSAFMNDKPVGLILATEVSGLADVCSLYVDEKYRQKGIGTNLMIALENELKLKSCVVVNMQYKAGIEENKKFEQILQTCQWKTAKPLIHRYFYKAADFNPAWMSKDYKIPKEFIIFNWSELTNTEKLELKRREDQWNFPSVISPFLNEKNIEYANSFGLKKGDEIVGWAITHRLDETTIRYSSLYIQPEYQFSGLSILLLIKAMKKQKELISEGHLAIWALFDLNLEQTEPIWQGFIKKRLAPYAIKKIVIKRTFKVL